MRPKPNFAITFIFLVLLTAFHVRSQDSLSLRKILFDQEPCKIQLNLKNFLNGYSPELGRAFSKDRILSILITEDCTRFKSVEDVTGFGTVTELSFDRKIIESIFESIVFQSKTTSPNSEWWEFMKPGRIFYLDKNNNKIGVISINTCAQPKTYQALISSMRKHKQYSRVFAIRCGGDKRDFESF
jgi:hypothetical protein